MPEKNNQELLMDLQQLKQEKNALKTLCNHKAAENEKLSERLRSFEWMFKKKQTAAMDYVPDYGDLSQLNKDGLIKKSIQKDQLQDIVSEYLDLLETSAAIYEKNGDYAMGIFSSGWCQMMDAASRRLCNTDDNRMALAGGDWLCHDSCWNDASLRSMNEGKPAEVACHGGLHIYAVPVRANKQIIGAINFGFGSPPKDDAELEKLSVKYKIPLKELREHSRAYKDRPQFIIDYAKQRIQNSAKYLGYLVERKIADDRLLEIKERYRIISETTSDFTFSCIKEKNRYVIDWIAGAVKKVTGYSVDDIKANTCWRFMVHPDDDPLFVKHVLSLKPGEESACELRVLGPNNTVRWLSVNTICLVDEEKNKRKIYGGCEDITERKRVELLLQEGNEEIATQNEELNQANLELNAAKEIAEESDRLKSAFLANMSHEIRTPMNGILGFADLLKEPGLTGEKQQKYVTIIENSGVRMLNIINDIVDISRIEAGVMEVDLSESNINEQLDYIYSFFKPQVEAKGMHLILSEVLHQGQENIITDREKLFAVLTNLVKNAIRYTHEGIIEFGCHKKGSSLEFFVRDTGIGIHKDRQQAIFDRFVQADIEDIGANQGAGLGLAISKAYVGMLEGEIWVESEKDKGSTFYFTLPYKTVPAAETIDRQLVPSEKTDDVRKLKILIVEDDEVSEVLLDETVNMFGKEILKARTGVEALEVCHDNPDTDLIFMDIRLPDMGGYEATKQIREFNKEVVIIAQTAYGLTGDREKAIESGCNDYIAKPIKKSELQALIQKYFGK